MSKKDNKKDNVVFLDMITTLDIPVKRVTERAGKECNKVLVLGWDKEDKFYFSSSFSDAQAILWLISVFQYKLMNGTFGIEEEDD